MTDESLLSVGRYVRELYFVNVGFVCCCLFVLLGKKTNSHVSNFFFLVNSHVSIDDIYSSFVNGKVMFFGFLRAFTHQIT